MSYEIVYTSSLQGLNGSGRGFCTVAATSGIPRVLQEKLESLSGYRHLHSPGSKRNAVNYCCQTIRIQQEPYIVLSRIADAGNDFSGRSNKIAHHLALSLNEARATSSPPTALLADREFWYTKWSGEPLWLPAGRMPTPVPFDRVPCDTWKSTFGDAGWAGIVARSAANDSEPVCVILPEACNALGLVKEALQLLPPRLHWKVSFSTYFARTSGGECQWRFLRDGMDEATAVRSRPVGIVIDSKSRIDPSDDDAYMTAARSGDHTVVQRSSAPDSSAAIGSIEGRPVTQSQRRRREAGARAREARLAAKARPDSRRGRDMAPGPQSPAANGGRFRKWWIAAGVLLLSVISILVVWLIVSD